MIEGEIYTLLIAESRITENVSETAGQPSVFPNYAPENCEFPYVVFSCGSSTNRNEIEDDVNLDVQVFNYGENRDIIQTIVKGVIIALNRKMVSNEWYKTVRIFQGGVSEIDNLDIFAQQYSINFDCVSSRHGIISNL